jgi:spectinomycin phosphotransferase
VETPPPAGIDEGSLAQVLAGGWAILPDELRYVPKGAGGYHWEVRAGGAPTHFVTVDDLDTKPWLGHRRADTYDALAGAYGAAWALRHHDGLESIVAPLSTSAGDVLVRLDDGLTMAVFPFVKGRPGAWRDPLDGELRARLLRELARLHAATRARGAGLRRRLHDLPERDALVSALGDVDTPWAGTALAEPARHALAEHGGRVRAQLDRFDDLARHLASRPVDLVVTHGEPHPGNLIHTPTSILLIDWDTVALAEPERDLWMLRDGDDDSFREYCEVTGRTIDEQALDLYQLMWTLSDIAAYLGWFRDPASPPAWVEPKWSAFVALLEGHLTEPYAPRT